MRTLPLVVRSGAAALAVVVSICLAACGSGSTPDSSTAAGTTAPAPGQGGGRGFDPALRQKIDACLQAAGLPVPTARARPTDDATPGAQAPGGQAPGAPGQGGGPRGGGGFDTPQDQAALKACGIVLPTRRPAAGSVPTA